MKKLLILGALASCAANAVAVALYDNFNLPVATASASTASNGNVMMGGAVLLAGGAGPMTLETMTVRPVFRANATYQALRVTVSLWGSPDIGLTSATPAATDAVFKDILGGGPLVATLAGPLTVTANTFTDITLTLPNISTISNFLGIQIRYDVQNTVGGAFVSSTNVTNAIMLGSTTVLSNGSNAIQPAVGSNIFADPGGWWRSSTGGIDPAVSFQSQNGRFFGTASGALQGDQSLAVQFTGVVPEPASMTALALGAAAMLRRRKK